MLNQKQLLSQVRSSARDEGCVLREQNMTINGAKSYRFVDKASDFVLIENMTLQSAWEQIYDGTLSALVQKHCAR